MPEISRRRTLKNGAIAVGGLATLTGTAAASKKKRSGPCSGLWVAYQNQLEIANKWAKKGNKKKYAHHQSLAKKHLEQYWECLEKHQRKKKKQPTK